MIFAIKKYFYLGIGVVISALVVVVKVLSARNSRLSRKLDTAQAKANRAAVVVNREREIEREFDSRTEDLAKEIEEDGKSSELSDPNDWGGP